MTDAEQLQTLAAYMAIPDPGDPPRDPATLGDPSSCPKPWAAALIRDLQAGTEPGDALAKLSPADQAELLAIDPNGDPKDAIRAQLAKRWRVLNAADLMQPPAPPVYLIDGMVRMPSLVTLYGAPGSLKTMLLMDLAVCVAAGIPWLDPLPNRGTGGAYGVKQGPVLWLDCDGGRNRLQERFGALCRAHKVTRQVPLHAIPIPTPLFNAGDSLDPDLLAAQIDDLGACMCVIDNLGTVSGGADENASQMVDIMARLRGITEQTGAVLWPIHHARKGSSNGGREGDRLRGHSSIEASLDLALLIERESDTVTLQSTKTRDDPVRPFEAMWTYEQSANRALLEGRFWHLRETTAKQPEYVTIAEGLSDLIEDTGGQPTQNVLREAIQQTFACGDNTARRAITYAEDRLLIVGEKQGAHRTAPKLYRAATPFDKASAPRGAF
jgi:hypothetical protein